jgi:DNA-directed RNA polymerase specialized sigma24 family protein
MNNANAGARAYALADERARADQRSKDFEDVVRAVNDAWLKDARADARRIVGAYDVEDAISITWEKVFTSFDGDRGTVRPFFFRVLRNVCYDILRARKRGMSPLPGDDALLGQPEHDELAPDPADEVVDRIDDRHDRITAAIAVLDLTKKQRDMLCMLLDDEEADVPDDPADAPVGPKAVAAAARQQKKRLRYAIDGLAGLTSDELRAASLLRRHHTIAAAAAAASDLDVPGLFASARRKVLALFGIETETED